VNSEVIEMTTVKPSARDRLLAAADELFYDEGVQTVGIDRVIEKAGVAKASLYNAFGSKDELVRAYLDGRAERRRERLLAAVGEATGPRGKLLAIFDVLVERTQEPGYHGCAFVRASTEAKEDSGAVAATEELRSWTRELLTGLARDAGARGPAELARQLQVLYDGAATAAWVDDDRHVAEVAREAAGTLIDAACR
jgi:AcrR family transcriptional regulator